MKSIIEKIKKIDKLYHVKGCTTSQVKEAQSELGLEFPEEFIDYVKEYGAISFYGTEWTGLNVNGYLNVVEATKQEREFNSEFPTDCFVLENQAIDGLITAVNNSGNVFTIQYNKKIPLCDSISEYLDICIARKK
ncbi:hypothetical protein HMPREF9970_1056 [Lachnoanaerobaculum saburreum F0468]|jgi:hypothetical protein|uniref:Knr4/Smi1-like domain-containing protein n=1 Tax=Lachnoanaerobaculum saburreum F0468 TaxID=1095750 RepID=I0R920_9FIRM|nr:SMI1/KNR4 family protein [Lachnoanaerobaculum saburreum]EIC96178.1 hypothetical protein HMPREF9970_1056 [Lachnoanaerobaculum saburreum F0468]